MKEGDSADPPPPTHTHKVFKRGDSRLTTFSGISRLLGKRCLAVKIEKFLLEFTTQILVHT